MMHQYSCPAVENNPAVRFFKDVMAVVQRHCEVWDVDGLMNSLTACFEANGLPVQNGRIQPELAQLLTPDKMRCGCRANDWEEAVRLACGVLTETGDVTAEFERSAVESVKRAGPYIVIMPGIALVHGEAGKGVHRRGGLFRLPAPGYVRGGPGPDRRRPGEAGRGAGPGGREGTLRRRAADKEGGSCE